MSDGNLVEGEFLDDEDGLTSGNCLNGEGRLGVILLGRLLPLNPFTADVPRLKGRGRELDLLFTNHSGSCGVVLGRGGIYFVVEEGAELFEEGNGAERVGSGLGVVPIDDPP